MKIYTIKNNIDRFHINLKTKNKKNEHYQLENIISKSQLTQFYNV